MQRLQALLRRLLWRDYLGAGMVTVANFMIVRFAHHWDVLGWGGAGSRDGWYAATATTFGIVVGFTITALAFFYTVEPGRRLAYVRRAGGQQLRRVWIGALTAPLFAVAVLTVALRIDTSDVKAVAVQWAVEYAVLLAAIRFIRLIWLFSKLLEVTTEDTVEPPGSGRRLKVHGPRGRRPEGSESPASEAAEG